MSRELRFGRPAHVGVIPLGDGLACSRSARSNPQPVRWFGGVASLRKNHQENLTQFGHLFKTSAQASLRSEKVSGLDRNGCPNISETGVRIRRTAQLAPETGLASVNAPVYWAFAATLLSIRSLLKRTLHLLSGTPSLMSSDNSSDS